MLPWCLKVLGPTAVTREEAQCGGGTGGDTDTKQPGCHRGDPTCSQHSDMKQAPSTPMQHLAEPSRLVIVSVIVQA